MKKLGLLPLAAVGLVFALSGCSDDDNGLGDAPVSNTYRDDSPAQIINFPDGFRNFAMKCDHHGNMLYSDTRDAGSGFIVPDKKCPNDWPVPAAK